MNFSRNIISNFILKIAWLETQLAKLEMKEILEILENYSCSAIQQQTCEKPVQIPIILMQQSKDEKAEKIVEVITEHTGISVMNVQLDNILILKVPYE